VQHLNTVLIVGLGQIGMGYDLHLDPATYIYSHARAFSRHPHFRLMGSVDPDVQRRQMFGETYHAPAFPDVEAALDVLHPDVVVLAVPTPQHGSTLQRVLRRSRPQIVLCEKPLSYDVAEAREMVETCAAVGVRLYVNYIRRSDPGAIEIKRRIQCGELGAPMKGVVWYSKGFLHNGSHYFNLLEYWLGAMRSGAILNDGRAWTADDQEPDIRVEFERGEAVFLAAWEEAFSHYTAELISPEGRLRYERGGSLIEWQSTIPNPEVPGGRTLAAASERIESGMDRYQWQVTDQLAKILDDNPGHLCTGTEALATLTSMSRIMDGVPK
jgi:predicted dehydrogenase